MNIQVDVTDEITNHLLQRYSALEMEMLEMMGFWKIKKCEDGVLGFFFKDEDDCCCILERMHWLVNGVHLNINPWLVEGEVRLGEFEVAMFWVQFHGLPIWCLSNNNPLIIAKKVGFFLTTDGKPKSWIQFKYEKLPLLCFNCGRLPHRDRICHTSTTMVTPKSGNAVHMYGTWIKSDKGRSNYFNMAGKGVTKLITSTKEITQVVTRVERGKQPVMVEDRVVSDEVSYQKGDSVRGGMAITLYSSDIMMEDRGNIVHGNVEGTAAEQRGEQIPEESNVANCFCIGAGDKNRGSQKKGHGRILSMARRRPQACPHLHHEVPVMELSWASKAYDRKNPLGFNLWNGQRFLFGLEARDCGSCYRDFLLEVSWCNSGGS
ncbi:hypothetical protein G4B88_017294 [Cannabis sativa]|uniref:Zinc knuckle CX2CX4HX4C domain-containing protein n=1 Tax=Cannabis sativa TaxID=3483 RepID=A0A7J6HRA7_CANSA|nr:hypothetical protein G4B88_017294 [Cannabis sativa]